MLVYFNVMGFLPVLQGLFQEGFGLSGGTVFAALGAFGLLILPIRPPDFMPECHLLGVRGEIRPWSTARPSGVKNGIPGGKES